MEFDIWRGVCELPKEAKGDAGEGGRKEVTFRREKRWYLMKKKEKQGAWGRGRKR